MASLRASVPEAAMSQTTSNMARPEDRLQSRHNSISSESSGVSNSSAQEALKCSVLTKLPVPSSTFATILGPESKYPVDPLSRDYPKPTGEVNLDEMLARKPVKRSLAHYISEIPLRERTNAMKDKRWVAQDLEEKKRELLEAKKEIQRLSIPG